MKRLMLVTGGLLLAASGSSLALAQATPSGVRGDLIAQLDDAGNKLAQLAQAIPQDKYSWRPAPGVRSIGEVLMHVTSANYFFAGSVGGRATPPDTTISDKRQVAEHVKGAFAHARSVIAGMSDADLDKPTTLMGRPYTYRSVLLLTVTHAHEHLGQMIAYARANAVTPPWSMAGN
ncbi:MAG TPA: DinB family protein [Gemmatimonadales bacterium]